MRSCTTEYPGVLISAPQGRSGKTIASLAICAALNHRGIKVQPFKKGPDYIDPSWLSEAAGRDCRNLDLFLMAEEMMLNSFRQAAVKAEISIVEGAMGLYDAPEISGWGSTAHLAQLLNLPVIFVVDCTRMTGSIAAMISGYQKFQPGVNIAGVILNNVSGTRHKRKLEKAVTDHCRIPVVGSIPRNSELNLTQRHLGHIPFPENNKSKVVVERIRTILEGQIDLDAIMEIAANVPRVTLANHKQDEYIGNNTGTIIGVMKDRVFNFYYPENLEDLERNGAKLVTIDSLHDRLPEIDGLYIGGGFPEFFLKELEANGELRHDIASAIEEGLPVYAECAGLMYLCQNIRWKGQKHEMVGVLPAEIELSNRPQGHGYVEAQVLTENPLFPIGLEVTGHEFHHSKIVNTGKMEYAYRIKRGSGAGDGLDGIVYKNVFASYTHLHALGTTQWAKSFVSLVKKGSIRRPLVSISVN